MPNTNVGIILTGSDTETINNPCSFCDKEFCNLFRKGDSIMSTIQLETYPYALNEKGSSEDAIPDFVNNVLFRNVTKSSPIVVTKNI